MVNPSQVNRRKYERAQEYIRSGAWIVDVDAGTIFSVKWQRNLKPRYSGKYPRAAVPVWIPETKQALPALLSRIIWESVHGPIPDGLEVNHMDGDPKNNSIANFELTTCAENIQHAHRTGLHSVDIPPDLWRRAYEALDSGASPTEVRKTFGLSTGSVHRINTSRPGYVKPVFVDPDASEKKCPRCGRVKPIDQFNKCRSRRDGRQNACRDCDRARRRPTPPRVFDTPEELAAHRARQAGYSRAHRARQAAAKRAALTESGG